MKTIGVIPLFDYKRDSYWMIPGYLDGIRSAGGFPVVLPLINDSSGIEKAMELCDGFLFTGGQDVEPKVYNEEKTELCGETSPERDEMEKLVLEEAMKRNKPVLGICRGIQFINACLGGTLWQDIPSQFSDKLKHCQKPPYDQPVHDVQIIENSPLHDLLKKEKISVNSYHHQGVRELSPQLKAMATASDGLTEAVYAPGNSFLWAVQWHPEFSFRKDENSRLIFKAFIDHCNGGSPDGI